MLRLDQICTYAHNEEQAIAIKRSLGLENAEWKIDEASGLVDLPMRGIKGQHSKALLQSEVPFWFMCSFCFAAGGVFGWLL